MKFVIDLLNVTETEYLAKMASALSFSSNWGKNLDALFDCLTTLRGPAGDEMTGVRLSGSEQLVLVVVNTAQARFDVKKCLYDIVSGVNQLFIEKGLESAILLDLRDGMMQA